MASHQLAIAKASFSAALLRQDPTAVSRDEIETFHALLNAVILQCSPPNIQKCKQWILGNIIQSTARFTALGKYFVILTSTFVELSAASLQSTSKPSLKKKCLHVLYLLNDILYHAKVHIKDASISSKIQPSLVALFSATGSFKNCPRHDRRIQDLLDIWAENAYYSADYIAKLREAVRTSSESDQITALLPNAERGNGESGKATSKTPPFVMPAMHGDLSTPWYDLPAANLMPHIVPNSTRPIRSDLVKPLQFVAGPADEKLANAVKEFLVAVDDIFGESREDDQEVSWDVNELGQQIHLDEVTGEAIHGEGYYGWSKEFCEKMRSRRKGPGRRNSQNHSRSRSSSRSCSESGSEYRRPLKRGRRHSASDSNSSRSSSRSRSRSGFRKYRRSRTNTRSLSRSQSPSERERFADRSKPKVELDNRPNTLLPPPQNSQPPYSHQPMPFPATLPPPPPSLQFMPPIAPPFGSNGVVPPPPPPQGYNGTWLPAPPLPPIPPPAPYGQPNQNWPHIPQFNGPPQHWQTNGPSGWNGMMHQPYPGDGGAVFGWNGAQPRQYQNHHQQNQGYSHGPYRGRGNFRGRGRG